LTVIGATALGVASATALGASKPPQGGQVLFGQEFPPDCLMIMLNSCNSSYAARIVANGNILQNMLTANKAGKYVPVLATKIPTGNDVTLKNGQLSVTWHIQPAAKWSDGKNLTTDDVIFTWKTEINPAWSVVSRTGWRDISTIKKIDSKTFKVVFKKGKTYAPWKDLFSESGGTFIYPKHVLAGQDINTVWNNGGFDKGKPFVGSGPYMLKSYSTDGSTAVVVKSPKYWGKSVKGAAGGGPNIAGINYSSGIGSTGVITQIKSGELNLVYPLPNFALTNQLPSTPNLLFTQQPEYAFEHIALNTEKPPLNDVNVRRALAYALNRTGVASAIGGHITVLNSILAPNQFGYTPAYQQYTYNPAKAQQILKDDGWAPGGPNGAWQKNGESLTIKINYTPSNTQRQTTLTYLASQAKAAGFNIIPNPDPNIFASSLPQGDFQAAEFTFIGSTDPSETSLLDAQQVPTQANNFAGQNYYRYTGTSGLWNASDYALSLKGTPIDEPAGGTKRLNLLKKAQNKLAADVPFIPLYQPPATLAMKNTLVGPTTNPTQVDFLWNSAAWYFKGGKA
jgi:peptide/nickel transport system substrate-binding protein